jgi:hypothetical protein
MAEREGFEPPVPFGITGFQDQLLKPLGHLSSRNDAIQTGKLDFVKINKISTPSPIDTSTVYQKP